MEDLNSNLDRIEMYLRGTLSQDELIIFEKELNTNSSFADELEKCRLEKDMANLLIAEDLRKKFEGPSELVKEKKLMNKRRLIVGIITGLCFALLVILIKSLFKSPVDPIKEGVPKIENRPPKNAHKKNTPAVKETKPIKKNEIAKQKSPEYIENNSLLAIVNSSYQAPESLFGDRKYSNIGRDTISSSILAFNESDYVRSKNLLLSYLEGKNSSELGETEELLGHIYFKNGEFENAAKIFESIVKENQFIDEAEWYLLLSLIAQSPNHQLNTDKLLEKISTDSLHNHQSDAFELLRQIKH